MKQYRKTRPETSPEGVRRAKAVWEGRKVRNGERVGRGRLGVHPMLRKFELERMRERAEGFGFEKIIAARRGR